MTTFDKREDAFEKKFAHDAELRFKAEARRNRMLGTWAAGLLGKRGADADAYVRSVIEADFEQAHPDCNPSASAFKERSEPPRRLNRQIHGKSDICSDLPSSSNSVFFGEWRSPKKTERSERLSTRTAQLSGSDFAR